MKINALKKASEWIKKNRFESLLLATIILLAAYLRLYRISEYMTFLGDEGRDVLVVRRLLVDFDPILVGPGTSIGNMYLGPLYYYMMAPFLLLFNFSPAGPAVMIAILGIITVYFVWYVAREWFGKTAAFVSALLFASAPVVIIYSRSSWNPNIMPFFALLSVYSIWRVYKNNEFKWLPVLGLSYAFVLNSHYLGLLMVFPLALYWLLSLLKIRNLQDNHKRSESGKFIKYSVFGLVIFLFLMSPLAIFDARHGWRNFTAIKTFFTVRQETVSIKPWTAFPKILSIWEKINTRLLTAFDSKSANYLAVGLGVFIILYLIKNIRNLSDLIKKTGKIQFEAGLLLFVWIATALIGFGVYKQEIYDHYYGFIFPAVFILLGFLFQKLYSLNRFIGGLIILIVLPLILIANLKNSPINYPPNRQLQRTIDVAHEVEKISLGREFNFAVIAERNYEGAYEYFLEKENAPIVIIDPQRSKETIKDQLLVVCEMPVEKCDPTHNSKAEVANFGWSKIESQEGFEGVTIFKLIHY